MSQQDSSYVSLDDKLVLGPSQRHDSKVVSMANYSALLVDCHVFQIRGDHGPELTVSLQIASEEENPCWLTDGLGWLVRATTIGRFRFAPALLCMQPLEGRSKLRARLRYQTGPGTAAVMFSTGIHRRIACGAPPAADTTPMKQDTHEDKEAGI